MSDTLKNFIKSFFGGSRSGSAGAAGQAAGANTVTATATTETGKEKKATIDVKDPRILTVLWGKRKWGAGITDVKYDRDYYINIATEQACGYQALVHIHCEDWSQPDHYLSAYVSSMLNAPDLVETGEEFDEMSEGTFVIFSPRSEWLSETAGGAGEISVEVFIVTNPGFWNRKPASEHEYFEEAIRMHKEGSGENYRMLLLTPPITFLAGESAEKVNVSKIIIVIDPGHGHTKVKTGTSFRLYDCYVRNDQGQREKENGVDKIVTLNCDQVPDYVIDNPAQWFKKYSTKKKGEKDIVQTDSRYTSWNEREIVFELGKDMRDKLQKAGYQVFMTREVALKEGKDDLNELYRRNKLSNDKKADYFISLHVNGNEAASYIGARGAFYVYRDDDTYIENTKALGEDMVRYLRPVNPDNNDYIPISSPDCQGVAVLSTDKTKGHTSAKHKTLIEIGTVTNPYDARILSRKSIIPIVSDQLLKGLYENIDRNY